MASPNNAIRVAFEPLRVLAFGGITNVYAAVGTPLANSCRLFEIVNTTDELIYVSLDGVTDQFVVPGGGSSVFDFTTNRSDFGGIFCIAANTEVWVRAPLGNPTLGDVYVVVCYGAE